MFRGTFQSPVQTWFLFSNELTRFVRFMKKSGLSSLGAYKFIKENFIIPGNSKSNIMNRPSGLECVLCSIYSKLLLMMVHTPIAFVRRPLRKNFTLISFFRVVKSLGVRCVSCRQSIFTLDYTLSLTKYTDPYSFFTLF